MSRPTAVTATSVPALSRPGRVTGSAHPCPSTGTVTMAPLAGEAAWTDPSTPTTATAPGILASRGAAAGREATAGTAAARTVPSAALTAMTRSAPWATTAPLVSWADWDRVTVVGSTEATEEAAVSGTRTFCPDWVTSKLAEVVRISPSICRERVLRRATRCWSVEVTHTAPSLRSTSAWGTPW